MATSKLEHDWWHTANMMALTINQNRQKGVKAVQPKDLHPTLRANKQSKVKQKVGVEALKFFLPPDDPARKN